MKSWLVDRRTGEEHGPGENVEHSEMFHGLHPEVPFEEYIDRMHDWYIQIGSYFKGNGIYVRALADDYSSEDAHLIREWLERHDEFSGWPMMAETGEGSYEGTTDGYLAKRRKVAMQTRRGSYIRMGGTWALPYTEEKAQRLVEYLRSLGEEPIHGSSKVEGMLSNLFGDDMLYDDLDRSGQMTGSTARKFVAKHLAIMLDDYRGGEIAFNQDFAAEAVEILDKFIQESREEG